MNKKSLVALLGAATILGGCASNAPRVMRDNAYVLSQGGEKPIYFVQTTPENYQRSIDLIQKIGESGAVEGFTFPAVYSLPTATEKTKEEIALQVANRYTIGQLTNIALRYYETLSAAEMAYWAKDAFVKDVISAAMWASVISASSGAGGNGGGSNGGGSTQTIGAGSSNRNIGDVTRSAVSRSIQ